MAALKHIGKCGAGGRPRPVNPQAPPPGDAGAGWTLAATSID